MALAFDVLFANVTTLGEADGGSGGNQPPKE
jgi:hypothetical protein